MADCFTASERSRIMAAVRSRENQATELRLISLLRATGITGWRRRVKLIGSPDFVWRKQRFALFVDGCFWHGCPRHGQIPASRVEYWVPKLIRNKRRDREVTKALRKAGWSVLRVWECALTQRRSARTIARIAAALQPAGDFSRR